MEVSLTRLILIRAKEMRKHVKKCWITDPTAWRRFVEETRQAQSDELRF